ncbi:hypothetical protein [Massilia rubra]|uniref:Uncharacterized protein n=1 Tax=Massilia rubra TaxID=2607910 RepID=A0ABX0LCP0_9BURK|nr:hypothetical protein [Massilia rubra]NHZ32636.1 hypothetical protein [Massilia rubra]
MGKLLPGILFTALFASSAAALAQTTPTDGEALRAELHQHYPSLIWVERYPSLIWVERYRQAYPAEAQGDTALWRGDPAPALDSSARIVDALAALQDQHVALAGPKAGKQETLGVLFRTSGDAAMVVWRHLDPDPLRALSLLKHAVQAERGIAAQSLLALPPGESGAPHARLSIRAAAPLQIGSADKLRDQFAESGISA